MSGRVAVIVASYNRPRMLREALESIEGADLVIVADDGSDFDVEAVASPALVGHYIIAERTTPAERMASPRCGMLINDGIRIAQSAGIDYVTVLCDDDLLAPGWLEAARAALDADPRLHMVLGKWGLFNDGEQPDPSRLCEFTFEIPATAGNFVYRVSCATEEQCWWREDTLAVHDGPMLFDYMDRHGMPRRGRASWLAQLDVLAGYRREHERTISHHSLFGADRYLPSAELLFAQGRME